MATVMQTMNGAASELKDLSWRDGIAVVGATLLGIGALIVRNIGGDLAIDRLDNDNAELYADAIGQAAGAIVIITILAAAGWLYFAGVQGTWVRRGLRGSAALVGACLLPILAIRASEWDAKWLILAQAADIFSAGFFEEVAFRGLVFVFLATALRRHTHGVLLAAIFTAVIFGVLMFSPAMLLLGPMFSLAFTRLQLDTRSIWPAVVLHGAFDWLSELPFDVAGEGQGSGWVVLSVFALIVATVLAVVRLWHVHDAWPDRMSGNVAPL